MKRILIAFLTVGMLSTTACNDWLDIRPRTEVQGKEILSTQKGFCNVLTGAYMRMKNTNIYGGGLMWGTIEFMAQHWENNSSQTYTSLMSYTYTNANVEDRIAGIYENLYKVIADVNGILEVIDSKQDVFEKGYFELVKGEALGLRAYCHLDLLRLFGPIPTSTEDAGLVLPYVKTVTNHIHDYLTYDKFIEELLKDLNEAEKLLAMTDPVLEYSIAELNNTSTDLLQMDNYLGYRQVRMNYYAVQALKARFYLWTGDMTNAGICANSVINAKDPKGTNMYRLGNSTDMTNLDYALTPEHIFALDEYRLGETATNVFLSTNTSGNALVRMNYYLDGTFSHPNTDIRRVYLWKEHPSRASYYYPLKFMQKEKNANPFNQIPLLRLSEMYLIAAECAGTVAAGTEVLNRFYETRGVPAKTFADPAAFEREIIAEYNREFYGEGQSFFAYKRLNSQTIQWYYGTTPKVDIYVLPRPQREINFTNN